MLGRLIDGQFPPPPEAIRPALQNAALARALRHLPMIYAVAMFNLCIVIVLCFEKGMSVWGYGWMPFLLLAAGARMAMWVRYAKMADAKPVDPKLVVSMSKVATLGIGGLSAWSVWGVASGFLADGMLIPVSLVFGASCIAHCLTAARVAATAVLVVGILPTAVTLILAMDDFQMRMLGLSMGTIAILMIRFVREQYDQLVSTLQLEQQIRDNANTDALTGLRNRRAMIEEIEATEHLAAGGGPVYAIAMLDLDGFKAVNDGLGHHVGDALLREVGLRLAASALPGDSVGRLGGDEFVVLFRSVIDSSDVDLRAQRLIAELCQPFAYEGHAVPIRSSVGTAIYPNDGTSADALMIRADEALYAMKRALPEKRAAKLAA